LERNHELSPGTWVTPRDLLYAVADRSHTKVDAYVGENDRERLHAGDAANFIPDALEFGRHDCRISEIDKVNVSELQEPALASVYGGALPVHNTPKGALIPVNALYRVRLSDCTPDLAPPLRLRGMTHLKADGQSSLFRWWHQALRILLREAGF